MTTATPDRTPPAPTPHPAPTDPPETAHPRPFGIAPLAMAPTGSAPAAMRRRRPQRAGMRRRLLSAALVTGTLATLPMTSGRSDERSSQSPESVSDLLAAAHSDDVALLSVVSDLPQVELASMTVGAEEATPATAEVTSFARVGSVDLVVPSPDAALIGFHEAGRPGGERMTSLAPLEEVLTARDVSVADEVIEEQTAPVIALPTRNRAQHAMTAVDVAMPEGADVLAPVTGRVVTVSPYQLYGTYGDYRVEIEVEGSPGRRVTMIHMDGIQVEPGDRVVAGESVIAETAKLFPFSSQIDRFTAAREGAAMPHVHMEVSSRV